MESFEQVAWDDFNEIVINKYFVHEAGFGSRAIPTYVREWIISHYLDDMTELSDGARDKIAKFVQKYAPAKSQKEAIKNDLFEQLEVKLLDNLSVYVNLAKGDRYLNIPYLDEDGAFTTPQIVQENEMLLSSGLWGVGTFYYVPKSDANPQGQIWMREFQPFQLANLDLGYLQECRADFSTQEWIDFLVSSMGFNCNLYSERQKILLICRLIPMVEPRYNLVELAPKGTGKSFVFENMSRYVAVRSGAITPAVLFFNDSRKTPGLITRYDCVVIDEAQKVKADSSGELTALLKSYLEAGSFGRGSASSITAEAGLVMLANIELDHRKQPIYEPVGLLRVFPNFLRETAFIDRFSGLLPGWDLPRVTKETPSRAIGLKGDIFGEILHSLRSDISYRDYVKLNMELENCDDMRDSKSIEAGTTGLLKIIFPDMKPSEEDFYKYCVNPALELRQRVRDELCKLDREYDSVSFYSKYPDQFQSTHQPAKYISPEEVQDFETTPKILLPDQEVDQDDVDYGYIIIYTGHGGQNPNTREQIADQVLKRWNLALALSMQKRLPIRVIRGYGLNSPFAPDDGYRYDGLYDVKDIWQERGKSGFLVWRYRIEKIKGESIDFSRYYPDVYQQKKSEYKILESKGAYTHTNKFEVEQLIRTQPAGYVKKKTIKKLYDSEDDLEKLLTTIKEYREYYNPNSISWTKYIHDMFHLFGFSTTTINTRLCTLGNLGDKNIPKAITVILFPNEDTDVIIPELKWSSFLLYSARFYNVKWGILTNGNDLYLYDVHNEKIGIAFSVNNIEKIIIENNIKDMGKIIEALSVIK